MMAVASPKTTPTPQASPERTSRATIALFAIVVVGTGLGGMTQTALNTMAAEVLADLHTDIGWGQWLTTIYIFAMGAAVPLAAFVQRRFSIRTLMLSAFSLYLIGSLCDFLAIDFAMLIIGRVLEAIATGILMPLLQTIAMTRFPENRHGTAMGFAGIALGFAPNIGPTIGGTLYLAFGWRFLFLILVIASVLLIGFTLAVVHDREARDPAATLDFISLILSTFGFGGLLLGFTAAANMALTAPLVWGSVIVGIICLVIFFRRQSTAAAHRRLPLINLRIFRSRAYVISVITQCLLYGCFVGMTLLIPLTLIDGAGHTTLEAGLVLFPGALAALIFEPSAGAAADRFGPRKVAIFGGCFLAAGAVSIALVPPEAPLWIPALCQTPRCVGLTTLIPTTTSWGLGSLSQSKLTTEGSANMIMDRQVAAALATAVMVFIVKTALEAGAGFAAYQGALGFSGLLGVLTLLMAILFIRTKTQKEPV